MGWGRLQHAGGDVVNYPGPASSEAPTVGDECPTIPAMSTSPESTERKIRQLDNDVQSIYEMLAGIEGTQRRHGNRLDEIDGSLRQMDGRLGQVDGRLGRMDNKLDRILGLLDR